MDIEAIKKEVEREVYRRLLQGSENGAIQPTPGAEIAAHLEHSLLNPDTDEATIRTQCAVARKYAVAAVCVAPYYVPVAKDLLSGSVVKVGTAIGFPHGCMSQRAKIAEMQEALNNGAEEIDVALNLLAIKSGRWEEAARELETLVRMAQGRATVKAVFEHCKYTDAEKVRTLHLIRSSGAEYLKIQNMLSGHGARVEDVEYVRRVLGTSVKIKIDGGIKTLAQARSLLAAGAERLGLTATEKIAKEALGQV